MVGAGGRDPSGVSWALGGGCVAVLTRVEDDAPDEATWLVARGAQTIQHADDDDEEIDA
jgi:hypothetical protein